MQLQDARPAIAVLPASVLLLLLLLLLLAPRATPAEPAARTGVSISENVRWRGNARC